MRETPSISSTNYVSNTTSLGGLGIATGGGHFFGGAQQITAPIQASEAWRDFEASHAPIPPQVQRYAEALENQSKRKEIPMTSTRRLVRVIIADTHEHVPLKDSVLYDGKEQFTDLTDQELYYEVDIKGILDKHNAKRVTFINKAVKERTEHLEPARVRDLKMSVVTIAQF